MKKPTVLSLLMEIKNLLESKAVAITATPVTQPRVINNRFTDNGDGTVMDNELKVLWVKDPPALKGFEKQLTWLEAKRACENLSFSGHHSGWRMPSLKEEQSIRDYTRHDPAWNRDIFSGKDNDWYWTSMQCAWNKDAAWCVGSYGGDVSYDNKSSHNYVRPVRSCQ